MGFLAGLFQETVPELPISTTVVSADATVEPGYLYRVAGSDSPIVVTMALHSASQVANKRFAVKVYQAAPTPPGGTLTIMVPAGQQIESEGGELGDGVELGQAVGTYREWLCDAVGNWIMINGGWS